MREKNESASLYSKWPIPFPADSVHTKIIWPMILLSQWPIPRFPLIPTLYRLPNRPVFLSIGQFLPFWPIHHPSPKPRWPIQAQIILLRLQFSPNQAWPQNRPPFQPNHRISHRAILQLLLPYHPNLPPKSRLFLLNRQFLLRLPRLPAEAVSLTPHLQMSCPKCNQKRQKVLLAHKLLKSRKQHPNRPELNQSLWKAPRTLHWPIQILKNPASGILGVVRNQVHRCLLLNLSSFPYRHHLSQNPHLVILSGSRQSRSLLLI